MAVIYEVTLSVDRAIEAEYRNWLDEHIRQMRALPGFTAAVLYDVLEPAPPAGQFTVCVRYRVHDQATLDLYLSEHAPRMRADGATRFGDRFRASRRVLASRSAQ
jgi:antibiotic biosynthesis monooxygenase (ABM) superfamily enzyme